MWREVDSGVRHVLENSLQSYRHELLMRNFDGIPTLIQHGAADDNVPAYHSRRMNQLIIQSNKIAVSSYVELEGKGHWFDGVMTTSQLRDFYAHVLDSQAQRPVLPQSFSIVLSNPADMCSRGGLVVDQLLRSNQLGRIDVSRESSSMWSLTTSNVRRFHFQIDCSDGLPSRITVDEDCLGLSLDEGGPQHWIIRSHSGQWQVSSCFYNRRSVC